MTAALRQRVRRLDGELLLIVALLLGAGLVMVASASVAVADRAWGEPERYFDRQLLYTGLGLLVGLAVLRVPLALYQRFSFALLGLALGGLLLVLLPGVGVSVNGARSAGWTWA